MILHNYVFVAGSTNPGCCLGWCFRRFCHVLGYLDFRLLRLCLSTANRNWPWNPIGQGSRFFQRMTKGTPGDEVVQQTILTHAHTKCPPVSQLTFVLIKLLVIVLSLSYSLYPIKFISVCFMNWLFFFIWVLHKLLT